MAPEMRHGLRHYGFAADVYALGVFLFELFSLRFSHQHVYEEIKREGHSPAEVAVRYRRSIRQKPHLEYVPVVSYAEKGIPGSGKLLEACFKEDPEERPTVSAVLEVLRTVLVPTWQGERNLSSRDNSE